MPVLESDSMVGTILFPLYKITGDLQASIKDVIVLDRKTFDRSRVNINFTRFLQKSTEKLLECYLISRIVMIEKSLSPELIQRTRSNIFDNSL